MGAVPGNEKLFFQNPKVNTLSAQGTQTPPPPIAASCTVCFVVKRRGFRARRSQIWVPVLPLSS